MSIYNLNSKILFTKLVMIDAWHELKSESLKCARFFFSLSFFLCAEFVAGCVWDGKVKLNCILTVFGAARKTVSSLICAQLEYVVVADIYT